MPVILRSALVEHSATRMFALVNDVAAYPRRFDWCRQAQILEQSDGRLLARLDQVDPATPVILKLTLPSVDGYFAELVAHPSVLKVVALSGGYSRDDANAMLARNPGVIASFSRALTEGLSAQQSDAEFDSALDAAIESIYRASIA